MMTNKEIDIYDYLVECGYFTCEELNLIRNIVSGTWEEIMNKVIFARFGYRTFEQFMEEEMDNEE